MFGKDDACARGGAVGTVAAFSDAIESITRCYDPGVRGRTFQILAEILERRGVLWGERCEVVDGFVDACGKAGCGDVVTEDAAIDDLRKKCGAGDEVADEVRDVFLAFGGEGFLIAGASAESDDDDFSFGDGGVE